MRARCRFGGRLTSAERAVLLEHRGRACYLTDENEAGVDALRAALDLCRELGDRRSEARLLQTLGEFLWCPGRVAEAQDSAREAVVLLESLEPSSELATAYGTVSCLGRNSSACDEAILWATRELDTAERLGGVESLMTALAHLGEAELLAGDSAGLAKVDRALELAEQHEIVGART